MFSKKEIETIQNIDIITGIILGDKHRFRITIIPDSIYYKISIMITDTTSGKHVYDATIQTADFQYIQFINTLRNDFIEYGALISKLNRPTTTEIPYISQQIFLQNLEMDIRINSNIEVFEAVKAHKQVLIQGSKDFCNKKIKTIKTNKIVR
ncbi:MAG: hypothetical protein E7165_03920 [Firmicutes bacterium]|nr:hypothetical protein [Bacillota bacterium]